MRDFSLASVMVAALVAGCQSGPAPEVAEALFVDITSEAGLNGVVHVNGGFGESWAPEIVGGGGGFVDYDLDGWLDVVIITGGSFEGEPPLLGHPAVRLFRNSGDGTFVERTHESGLAQLRAYSIGLTGGDYDNDGDDDLYVTTLYRDVLLRNDGGLFVDITEESGLAGASEWSTSAMFFDADHDGHLDLYAGTYVDWSPEKDQYCGFEGEKVYCTPELYTGIAARFYYNNGDGTFTERTRAAGFLSGVNAGRDKTLGVAELDANGDGWTDVVVANDTERDMLFVNRGDGTFVEQGITSGIAYDHHGKPRAGMGIDAGVVDSTGQPSIFVGNFSDEMVGVYRHTGGGLYIDRAASSRIGQPSLRTLTFGLLLLDADLDTDLDLLIANGHVQTHIAHIVDGVTFRQRPQLFVNDGTGQFAEAPPVGPLAAEYVARGAAYGDYDRDGDLDVLMTENNGPVHLWRNESTSANWLRITLEGVQSNRNAYGARIELWSQGIRQVRRIRSGSSYLSHSDPAAVFGLTADVDSIVIRWPNGRVDRTGPFAMNQVIEVVEDGSIRTVDL